MTARVAAPSVGAFWGERGGGAGGGAGRGARASWRQQGVGPEASCSGRRAEGCLWFCGGVKP
jgi:hypothetical protein